MAGSSTQTQKKNNFEDLNYFPPIQNGRINLAEFVKATSDLVSIVDCLGKMFNPVKYDMQGNIDKIKNNFTYDENSCLFELILKEKSESGNTGAEATLWLNRALLFFELTFTGILQDLKSEVNGDDIDMKSIFSSAYEGSVKKYHNWIVQRLFTVICKMSPTFPQIITSLGLESVESFENKMATFTSSLQVVRLAIDNFFKDNGLFLED
ncbi:glycolipid transfer protein [Zerene cesonia]|uniref:glycolipid transfer protein n=1 Tax=Zerene cesonia TaxID=33412 RepID=UPI0018E540CA|nr:glycolipid transfer protein [Zerene cesonia]